MIVAAAVFYCISVAVVLRTAAFLAGIVFFGQPVLVRGYHWLTQNVPDWRDYLELRM